MTWYAENIEATVGDVLTVGCVGVIVVVEGVFAGIYCYPFSVAVLIALAVLIAVWLASRTGRRRVDVQPQPAQPQMPRRRFSSGDRVRVMGLSPERLEW
jgi:hypothetical protein